jgi:hypothetical protein
MRANEHNYRTILYTRTATYNHVSIEQQVSRLERYATTSGFNIIDRIRDVGVGRHALLSVQRLIERKINSDDFDVILVDTFDRITRDGLAAFVAVEELLRAAQISLYTPEMDSAFSMWIGPGRGESGGARDELNQANNNPRWNASHVRGRRSSVPPSGQDMDRRNGGSSLQQDQGE